MEIEWCDQFVWGSQQHHMELGPRCPFTLLLVLFSLWFLHQRELQQEPDAFVPFLYGETYKCVIPVKSVCACRNPPAAPRWLWAPEDLYFRSCFSLTNLRFLDGVPQPRLLLPPAAAPPQLRGSRRHPEAAAREREPAGGHRADHPHPLPEQGQCGVQSQPTVVQRHHLRGQRHHRAPQLQLASHGVCKSPAGRHASLAHLPLFRQCGRQDPQRGAQARGRAGALRGGRQPLCFALSGVSHEVPSRVPGRGPRLGQSAPPGH